MASLYRVVNHVPFFDETNAWNIASFLKPSEIFEITRYEGHLFLWYYILMPFAKHDIGYPIAMQLINWIFALGAVLILWFRAPFNSITKLFITFSLPIKVFYTHARCYSIGLFLLFLLCSLYKNRLKHPYIYSILLILIGNTSVMALFLAFSLGVCFLFDLNKGFKNGLLTRKQIITSLFICTAGGLLILSQIYNFVIPSYAYQTFDYGKHLIEFFIGEYIKPIHVILLFCYLWSLAMGWKFFEKDKYPYLFMILSTYFLVLVFFGIYRSSFWHIMFLFIIFIIANWMYMSEHKTVENFQKRYLEIFCLIFILLTLIPIRFEINGSYIPTLQYMKKNHRMFENHKIFMYPTDSSVIGIIPGTRKYNLDYYDCHGNSYKSVQLYKDQWLAPIVEFDKMAKIMKKGETAYALVSISLPHGEKNKFFRIASLIYMHYNHDLKIKMIDREQNIYIWQIIKVE